MSFHDIALAAVKDVADTESHIGDFLDRDLIDGITILRFASAHPGYPHWRWCVALTGDDAHASVNEVWMEPGEGALQIPAWTPWSERIQPGDLGAGDVIETRPDDPRIMPGYTGATDGDALDDALRPPQWELGLGRERVLSPVGVLDATDRWRRGDHGPASQVAKLADHHCSTCAWLLPIGGLVGQAFGVCAHDMSPSDGHVVAMDHGCGAHSDVVAEPSPVTVTELIVDDDELDLEPVDLATPVDALEAEPAVEADAQPAHEADDVEADESGPASQAEETESADRD